LLVRKEAAMDTKGIFERREHAFEAEYFNRKDVELIDKLKLVFHKKIDKQSIREATGVADEQLLDRLVELNLNGELMAAFNLMPLVEVAWADGVVDDREVEAVLSAAEQHGLHPGSKAYAMLETRLREGPSKDARKIWFYYAETLRKTLSPQQLDEFRKDLLEICQRVAEASGGLLNLLFTVSADERRVIDAVERALTV
jgi:uncharacterized tellurite resistance protein B-like protein